MEWGWIISGPIFLWLIVPDNCIIAHVGFDQMGVIGKMADVKKPRLAGLYALGMRY
jgi:hypothetical protein